MDNIGNVGGGKRMATSILILGGTGETGSWFARYFKEKGFDVAVWGPSGKVAVADALGVRYAHDKMKAIEESDIVLKAMKTFAPKGVEVLGTHPMFGPTMPALCGQTIILTPVEGKSEKWLSVMRSLFESDGAHIEILDAEEHDEIMAVVQALTHFAYISIGATLRALDFDVERSRKFMSPVYEIMIDFVGRILDQNPELYASIQKNPKAVAVRQTFITESMRLCEMVNTGDMEGFKQIMRQAAEHYEGTHEALERSDRIIRNKICDRAKDN
ncbi:MAG: prephenate dehydrogenase/arogenate dehydrogenase family protein [Methanothrix sp.]|nr:prephenate dehydrogenase/arogenate dehydrogenase family protein [Methanothrix sp.]